MKKIIRITQEEVFPEFSGQVFSYGNKKLPESTMIVNLTSAQNCPAKQLGLCLVPDVCYAQKCERIYKLYRQKNLLVEDWLVRCPEEEIIRLLDAYIQGAKMKISHLRIDEAGDFRDQNQIDQWNRICGYLKQKYGIISYTYTARSDLDFRSANNIIVNASRPGVKGSIRMFLCTPRDRFDQLQPDRNHYKCPGDCKRCQMCATDKFKGIIYCRQH